MDIKDLMKDFHTDAKAEAEGNWFEVRPGVRFLLARSGGANKNYRRVMEHKIKPYKHQFDRGTLDNTIAEALMQEVFLEAVLLGWEGIETDGIELEFTVGNAKLMFNQSPELYDILNEAAGKVSNFLEEDIVEGEKS